MSESKITTNHDKIKAWVLERGGKPTVVEDTRSNEDGILRIDFGKTNKGLSPIRWEKFFKIFEKNNLALLYQEKTSTGNPSNFCKLIDRSASD